MEHPKEPEYLNNKIKYLDKNCKNKNIRDTYRNIKELKKGDQPGTNFTGRWVGNVACVQKSFKVFMGKP
jgi:hypothetical protein